MTCLSEMMPEAGQLVKEESGGWLVRAGIMTREVDNQARPSVDARTGYGQIGYYDL